MTDLVERLNAAARLFEEEGDHKSLPREAAAEIERLRRDCAVDVSELYREIERLRAVIVRAKDALLDGQSTQWVHDLLVKALHD
jgi:hypothetical protein